MSNTSNSSFITVTDVVNIILALCSWILPDVPIPAKVAISAVLIGLLILGRTNQALFRSLTKPNYVPLLISTVVIGIVEAWLVSISIPIVRGFQQKEIMQMGLAYAIVVGFPTMLGATEDEELLLGCCLGCAVVFFAPLVALPIAAFIPSVSFTGWEVFTYVFGPALLVGDYALVLLADYFGNVSEFLWIGTYIILFFVQVLPILLIGWSTNPEFRRIFEI